ncbi:MAG: hypothetical protein IK017_00570 [Paludibacteraceae bacterium]|nr:hypothetical protein [Paludibacteraceae bacterium]
MHYELPHVKADASVEAVLNSFFVAYESISKFEESIVIDNHKSENSLLCFLLSLLEWKYNTLTLRKSSDDAFNVVELNSISDALKRIENTQWSKSMVYLHYLTDEMVCNIQQHSCSKHSCGYVKCNNEMNVVDVCFADDGISIHGSYVEKELYLEKLTEGDASAISLAKNGYSTKDRPFAENRGFGISTNLKIVTDVLGGTFSIYSGKALYIKDKQSVKMIDLPYDVEWNGTIVIARVPLPPASFNMYNYI